MSTTDSATSLAKVSQAELKEASPETIAKLTEIFENLGFLIISDHDIPQSLIQRAINSSRNFFQLPEEAKRPYHRDNQVVALKSTRGYTAMGEEQVGANGRADVKQAFDLGIERPLGGVFDGPNVMPPDDVAPDFTASHMELQEAVLKGLRWDFGRALSLALGEDRNYLDQYLDNPNMFQRAVYYPQFEGSADKHTDGGLFSFVFQEDGDITGGHGSLRVYNKATSKFIPVEAKPTDLVVNLGESGQYISGGRFSSTPHEVRHNGKTTRVSLCFFFHPDTSSTVRPVGSANPEEEKEAESMTAAFVDGIWVSKGGAGRAAEFVETADQ